MTVQVLGGDSTCEAFVNIGHGDTEGRFSLNWDVTPQELRQLADELERKQRPDVRASRQEMNDELADAIHVKSKHLLVTPPF